MYNVYPYMYPQFRPSKRGEQEIIGSQVPFKRGDLEGYLVSENFASKPYADCTRAGALSQINTLNTLRSDMTPKEYINILIKQGQVPNKHFYYEQREDANVVTEINSCKEVTKEVIFNKPEFNQNIPITCRYYTPETGRMFKEINYKSNGEVETNTDYENAFDEALAVEQLEKLEELQKIGPQTVSPKLPENLFEQDISNLAMTTSESL